MILDEGLFDDVVEDKFYEVSFWLNNTSIERVKIQCKDKKAIQKELDDMYGEGATKIYAIEKIDEELEEISEIPASEADITVDPTPDMPKIEDIGIANQLINLINDEWEAIDGYNNAIANFTSYPEFIEVIQDISNEENNHIGMLQELLKKVSPNAETIEAGQEEANIELTEAVNDPSKIQDIELRKIKTYLEKVKEAITLLIAYAPAQEHSYLHEYEMLQENISELIDDVTNIQGMIADEHEDYEVQ